MDKPVDTAAVAAHLKATQGLGSIDIPSAYHSNWLDNTRPHDPRKVWYPG